MYVKVNEKDNFRIKIKVNQVFKSVIEEFSALQFNSYLRFPKQYFIRSSRYSK